MNKLNENKRSLAGIILLSIISVFVIALGTCIGSTYISFGDTVKVVFSKLFSIPISEEIGANTAAIIWQMRLPRVLLAFLTGAAMSVGGAITQSVLHNPLASPYTLGVSSGASIGAAVVMLFGITLPFLSGMSLAVSGSIFAVVTVVVCIFFAARVDKNLSSATLVLCGMVLSLFLSSVFTLVAGLSKDNMTRLIRWQMGSFSSKGWHSVAILFIVTLIGCIASYLYSRELDIMSFSDEQAASIGVDVKKTKWILLVVTAVMTGVAVSFAGVIGFIDLIAPHVARKLFSPKHKYVLVLSALLGGSFMVIADLVSRTIMPPSELPVGAVTALIGAPFFAYIYFSKRGGAKNA